MNRTSDVRDTSSTFSERERRRRISLLSQREATSSDRYPPIEPKPHHPLLDLFRLLQHYKIQIFSIDPDERWNIRTELGQGISFVVEEANLTISSRLSNVQYRSLEVKGPKESTHFIDHTHTAWDREVPVAFKSVTNAHRRMFDLATEFRVLCHLPLQRHPNITKLLGVVFIMEQDPKAIQRPLSDQAILDWKPEELPMLVIERAPHASLSTFLSSIEFRRIPSSLRTKMGLCIDVLNAIQALHTCRILHGDVKCDNVLVFRSSRSTAQNWTAKLTDFGHSVLNIKDALTIERPSEDFLGTPFYAPPELTCSPRDFSPPFLERIDIWSWGMLLWEVMTNGSGTKDSEGNDIDMHNLREQGQVLTTAREGCIEFLHEQHSDEMGLFGAIIEALNGSLHPVPAQRSSANSLFLALKNALNEQSAYTVLPSEPESIDSLPFFDITRLYYDLNGFVTVPTRIYNELQGLRDIAGSGYQQDAAYQMGLCRIAGFGTDRDFQGAADLVLEAAEAGHQQARSVALRLANALGIDLSSDQRHVAEGYLREDIESGSKSAMWDRGLLTSDVYESLESMCINPSFIEIHGSLDALDAHYSGPATNLVEAMRRDNLLQSKLTLGDLSEVDARGKWGDTLLHWAAILPEKHSTNLIRSILDLGVEIGSATNKECPLSDHMNEIDIMPRNTTALDWAVIVDNLAALLLMEKWISQDRNGYLTDAVMPLTSLLSYATRYQSVRCIEHLCKVSHELTSFDTRGFSPFYYAVRPDIFGRVLRYDSSAEPSGPTQQIAPFLAREVQVMNKLLESGSSLRMHRHNYFNCLHMAAAQGEPEILNYLLQNGGQTLVNNISYHGWAPIKDTIINGKVAAFHLLLKHNADTRCVWKGSDAIHLCCMFQGVEAVKMAVKLLDDDRANLNRRDRDARTPLHVASLYGHTKLITLFLTRGARLLDADATSLTPLGIAIRSRHVFGVWLISSWHRKRNAALMAMTRRRKTFSPIDVRSEISSKGAYVSALEYLLTPGCHTPNQNDLIRQGIIEFLSSGWSLLGCYDIPFSRVSLIIVDVLLDHYKQRTGPRKKLDLFCTYQFYRYESGVQWAVRTSNSDVVQRILDATSGGQLVFKIHLRDLIETACRRPRNGMSQLGSPEQRRVLIALLRKRQIEEFLALRDRRIGWCQSPILRNLWVFYYTTYGNMEQKQYEQATEWQLAVRPKAWWSDPRFLEFRQWHHPRLSIYTVIFPLLWALVLPTVICYAIVARDPASDISSRNIACTLLAVILINGLSLWPKVFRVLCVLFERACASFPNDHWIRWTQCLLCLSFMGLASINMWLLNPTSAILIRFVPNDLPNWSGLELPPWRRNILSKFQSLCRVLIVWTTFTQLIPIFLFVIFRLIRNGRYFRPAGLEDQAFQHA